MTAIRVDPPVLYGRVSVGTDVGAVAGDRRGRAREAVSMRPIAVLEVQW